MFYPTLFKKLNICCHLQSVNNMFKPGRHEKDTEKNKKNYLAASSKDN
jgi:hypothetical protein